MPATKRRQPKPPDPFAARPGETSADVYLRLHCKALAEGLTIVTNGTKKFAYNPTSGAKYTLTMEYTPESGTYIQCSCPRATNGLMAICKHVCLAYPPFKYRDPCPMCSGTLLYWHDPNGHAVRCKDCHYCEAWPNDWHEAHPAGNQHGSHGAQADYRELYGKERVEA